ncbi:hypothetical protein [Paenibacillus sp. NPDC058177]|uniref:hypothetical protein n=1 Tax=Paenibacillus sp. NPDC058177 TaxID=3346369 RepID=UPI0036DD8688
MHDDMPSEPAFSQLPLKVKGSLLRRDDIVATSVEVLGVLTARGSITTARLKVSGECSVANACVARQVKNLGSLRTRSLQAENISSSGYLSATQETTTGSFYAEGAVRMKRLTARNSIEIRLGNACSIDEMSAGGEISVLLSSTPFSFLMGPFRKMNCCSITGTTIRLERTTANLVCGEDVTIGPGCIIQELHYSKSLTVESKSKVKKVVFLPDREAT